MTIFWHPIQLRTLKYQEFDLLMAVSSGFVKVPDPVGIDLTLV